MNDLDFTVQRYQNAPEQSQEPDRVNCQTDAEKATKGISRLDSVNEAYDNAEDGDIYINPGFGDMWIVDRPHFIKINDGYAIGLDEPEGFVKVGHVDEVINQVHGNYPENVKKHAEICKTLNRLYADKNADYGDAFHMGYQKRGITMALIRLEDKLSRLDRLTSGAEQKVKDESIKDTLMDLSNYAIMTLMELEGQQ